MNPFSAGRKVKKYSLMFSIGSITHTTTLPMHSQRVKQYLSKYSAVTSVKFSISLQSSLLADEYLKKKSKVVRPPVFPLIVSNIPRNHCSQYVIHKSQDRKLFPVFLQFFLKFSFKGFVDVGPIHANTDQEVCVHLKILHKFEEMIKQINLFAMTHK